MQWRDSGVEAAGRHHFHVDHEGKVLPCLLQVLRAAQPQPIARYPDIQSSTLSL
jgi:hypothetical protein